jgi:hypothetical protein
VPCADGSGLACVDGSGLACVDGSGLACVDGSGLARRSFTLHRSSVRPCLRLVSAVRMTAGHNALRGSGPGQKRAFDHALAHSGLS